MASKAYDFRLRFWDRFLGSFLNASSSKVTRFTGRAAGRVLEPQKLHILGTTMSAQSFRSLVGLLCAPILVTRFASRVRAPVSESLCGPQKWTHAHSGHSIMKLAWCPESGPANWAENFNKKLLNGQRCLCPAPPT